MNKNKLTNFNLIRLTLLTAIIISFIYKRTYLDSYILIALLFLIIISNIILIQIDKDKIRIPLILINMPIMFLINNHYPTAFFAICALVLIDISFIKKESYRNILLFFYLVLILYTSNYNNMDFITILQTAVFLIIFYLMMDYLHHESMDKNTAEELYDKLRISEENLKNANDELKMMNESIQELTTLKERNRISREIHDSVGHALSTIIIQLGAISRISKENTVAVKMLNNLESFSKESLEKVRNVVRDLKPEEYKNIDSVIILNKLIEDHKNNTGVDISFSFSKDRWKLSEKQSATVYRIVQEFLSNSLKHSNSTKINIIMLFSENSLNLTLKDNGTGKNVFIEGFGLRAMRERADEIGARVKMSLNKDSGFKIEVQIDKHEKMMIYNTNLNIPNPNYSNIRTQTADENKGDYDE